MFAEILRERLAGVASLTSEQVALLERHYELLCRWNRVLNLTTVFKVEEAVERHYCESLFLGSRLRAPALRVADLGAGAGFPGLVVGVLKPECEVALIESHQRKAVFLREASRELPNIRVLALRAEAVQDRFDWLISRAVDLSVVQREVERLAANVAVLGGEKPPVEGWQWEEPVRLPWGERRFLWFHVEREQVVSRET